MLSLNEKPFVLQQHRQLMIKQYGCELTVAVPLDLYPIAEQLKETLPLMETLYENLTAMELFIHMIQFVQSKLLATQPNAIDLLLVLFL